MIPRALQYLYYSLRYPTRSDFVDMGIGIEARYERCYHEWQEHIQRTKSFIGSALTQLAPHSKIAVLGAGRLYDVPDTLLSDRFQVEFFDADPSARNFALRRYPDLKYRAVELSGVLDTWSSELRKFLCRGKADYQRLAQFLTDLRAEKSVLSLNEFDCAVSLNLLSQIPIFWRDRVSSQLKKRWRLESDEQGRFPAALQSALETSMQLLQRQHLCALAQIQKVLLIYDYKFCYRAEDRQPLDEIAIFAEPAEILQKYRIVESGLWKWHIAPQHLEQAEFDQWHEVHAAYFCRDIEVTS